MFTPPFLFLIQQFFVTTGAQLFDPYYGTYYDPMLSMYGGGYGSNGYGINPYYAYSPFNSMPSFSSPMGYGSSFMPSPTMPIMDFSPPAPSLLGAPSSTPSLLSLLNPFGGLANGLGSLGAPTLPTAPPPNPFQMNLGSTAAGHNASPFGRHFRTRTRGSLLGTELDDSYGKQLLHPVSQRESCDGDMFMMKRECKNSEKT
ncbi:hypothetical protein niasHT_019815 [Heterodera trifolii]|uniref:Uncharacterized protein n=1 Tax=Heterodera trifolii TaxID=157864 RepID=A0ABD2KUR3_9BILA